MEKRRQVVVIAGPTGSGESTITNEIIRRFSNVRRLVTATTRPPRSGEELNKDYYFFSKDEFLDKVEKKEILEVNYQELRDVYYGTYAPDLFEKLDSGYLIVVNPDIVGTKYFKENYQATTIFIAPPSIDELTARVQKRNPEMTEIELERRMEGARNEIEYEQPYYDYVVMNKNGELEQAVQAVIDILQKEGYTLS